MKNYLLGYMSNRADSRKHGMHRIERIRKKSKRKGSLVAKTLREDAHARQAARQAAIAMAKAEFAVNVAKAS